MEKQKRKDKTRSPKNQILGSGVGYVGKVLAPHNARPKTIPLIKCVKVMWFFQIFIFPNNNNK